MQAGIAVNDGNGARKTKKLKRVEIKARSAEFNHVAFVGAGGDHGLDGAATVGRGGIDDDNVEFGSIGEAGLFLHGAEPMLWPMVTPHKRDRPDLPEGYIPPEVLARPEGDGLLRWADVDRRLRDAKHYWMATSRPDGRPHVVPRWGAWIEGALYYDGSPETVHARNLANNPACTLHIGDGKEAIIVEGTARPSIPLNAEEGKPMAAEIARKYGADGYTPEGDAWSGSDAGGLVVFTPDKSLAWNDFPNDLTRFRF